jgi:sugar-specific transcriptional regulator TrmB
MLNKELEKFGLNKKEARIYLASLELGETTIQRIAKKSGVKRTTVYDIINSLKDKGLISELTKNKKTFYYAEDPRKLKTIMEEKNNILEKIMPELLSITNLIDKKPKIKFFEGENGIKAIYKDTLNYPNQELLGWGSEDAVTSFDKKFLFDYYLPKRVEKKIWVRGIAPESKWTKEFQKSDQKYLRKTKLIPSNKFPFEIEINLYGKNKIGIMSFKEGFGLIIESQKIFTTLKSIFEMNWNSL